jgi:predicted MFS family arabinose efflux permease
VGGIAGPFIGREVDRRSIRGLMILGAAFLAAGFLGLSRATSVWHLYLCFGVLISLGMALLGGIANTALVVNWFARRRGTALGISQIGVSLSGFVMAHVTTWLIEEFGWRTTTAFFGIVPLVLVAPLVWLVVVNRPENLGLFPDGDSRSPDYAGAANPGAETEGWTVRDALRQPAVWIIGLLIGFTFAANGAVIQVTHSHVTDLGFAAAQAATVLSLMAGMAALGKPTFGWLADRTTRRGTMFLCIALQTLGLSLLLSASNFSSLVFAALVFGMGYGGVLPLWGVLVGSVFGRDVLGRVMGLMAPILLPFQILGLPLATWIFGRTGSYRLAFVIFLSFYAVSAILLALLRLPRRERT